MMRKILATAIVAYLGACANYDRINVLGSDIRDIDSMPIEQASNYIAEKTVMTHDRGHGTQIEYFDLNGRAYLWYPLNNEPVLANWKLNDFGGKYDICFRYPSQSFNSIRNTTGGRWNCARMGFWAKDIVEVRSGDIFKLSSGVLPHKLSRAKTSFEELLSKNDDPRS